MGQRLEAGKSWVSEMVVKPVIRRARGLSTLLVEADLTNLGQLRIFAHQLGRRVPMSAYHPLRTWIDSVCCAALTLVSMSD